LVEADIVVKGPLHLPLGIGCYPGTAILFFFDLSQLSLPLINFGSDLPSILQLNSSFSASSLTNPFYPFLILGTYAIDSFAGAVGFGGKWRPFAEKKFRNGDIVTTELDLAVGSISYWLNGRAYLIFSS